MLLGLAAAPLHDMQARLYDGELEAARWCALEEASLDGSRLLAYLPGSILVNKEPLGTAFQCDICPNRITRSVLTAVYDLLQVRRARLDAPMGGAQRPVHKPDDRGTRRHTPLAGSVLLCSPAACS